MLNNKGRELSICSITQLYAQNAGNCISELLGEHPPERESTAAYSTTAASYSWTCVYLNPWLTVILE